jgi:hypothetical protein
MKRLTQTQRKLIEGHLRLACKMANKVRTSLSYSERLSAANWGLIEAATKWIPERGPFDKFASMKIHGWIIMDTNRAKYARLGGKRKGVSSQVHLEDWRYFGDYDPRFDWIDDEDQMSIWRKELASRMHRLTPAQTRAVKMRQVGLVSNEAVRQHGGSASANRARMADAIQRLMA